jgi:hypothetical protein
MKKTLQRTLLRYWFYSTMAVTKKCVRIVATTACYFVMSVCPHALTLISLHQCFKNVLLPAPIWRPKIATDPYIFTHINIVIWWQKTKITNVYLIADFRLLHKRTSSISNNAFPDVTLVKLKAPRFLGTGRLLIGSSNGHMKETSLQLNNFRDYF